MEELLELSCKSVKNTKLSMEEVEDYVALIDGWHQMDEKHIEKTFHFNSFREAVNFVNSVSDTAESENHHPDIDIRFNKIKLVLSTHSADSLTLCDFIMAAKINTIK